MNQLLTSVITIVVTSLFYKSFPPVQRLKRTMAESAFLQRLTQKRGAARALCQYVPIVVYLVLYTLLLRAGKAAVETGWNSILMTVLLCAINIVGLLAVLCWNFVFARQAHEPDIQE